MMLRRPLQLRRFLAPALVVLVVAGGAEAASSEDRYLDLARPGEPFEIAVHVYWGDLRLSASEDEWLVFDARDDHGEAAEIEVTHRNNRVEIRQPPPDEGTFASANLDLRLPSGGTIHLFIERGGNVRSRGLQAWLEVTNLNGSVDIFDHHGVAAVNASNGTIRAELVEPEEAPMIFTSLNGSVHLCLPEDAGRNVFLSTHENEILTEFAIRREPPARSIPAGWILDRETQAVRGRIGEGGPLLRASTVNGDVLLHICGR